MDRGIQRTAAALTAALLLSGCGSNTAAPAEEPISITVWNYYNGEQLSAFNAMVDEFNETVGREKHIRVESTSQGTVADLAASVLASANGEVGAQELPNVFSAYADTAYELDRMGILAELDDYLTEEERARYVESFLDAGRIDGDALKIFPVAKSVEILALNRTDWDEFSRAMGGLTVDVLSTVEGVTRTAEAYYNWTDSLTPEPNDGRAMFGRDALANYFFAGFAQQGVDLVSFADGQPVLNFDRGAARRLWDNYYIPYVKGYFTSESRFRNDDLRTGAIIACACSSSAASFLPEEVSTSDTESHPVQMMILPCPQFENGAPCAVQQGAGMVVARATEAEVAASVEFLKWFTGGTRGIRFSADSGYLPVTREANQPAALDESGLELTDLMRDVLKVSMETVNDNPLYAMPAFETANSVRSALERVMSDQAEADRALVLSALEEGRTAQEAQAPFVTDEHFEEWYAAALQELSDLMGR